MAEAVSKHCFEAASLFMSDCLLLKLKFVGVRYLSVYLPINKI